LLCTIDSQSDADNDSLTNSYSWSVNGLSLSGQANDVLSSNFTSGDSVTCEVISSDGTLNSAAGSSSVTIANRPPEVSSVTLSPDPAYTNNAITASAIASDLDGDSLSFEYTWSVAGIPVQAGSGNSLDISFYEKDDLVSVSVEAFDQTDFSSPVVESITISNTPPTTPGINISPIAPIESTDDLVCTVDSASSDIDGDIVSYGFSWTVDGTPYSNATDTSFGSTVAGIETLAGEEWICSVTPNDGTDNGGSVDSNVTIDSDWAGLLEFTNCGQTGQTGPSQTQCNSEYSGTTLDGFVTLSSGLQSWIVPASGTYSIEVLGAKGGNSVYNSGYCDGGNGAQIQGVFTLNEGDVLTILVGQMGGSGNLGCGTGGGGSFVISAGTPLIVAGGGGGAGLDQCNAANIDGRITTAGGNSYDNSGNLISGGTSGNGGGAMSSSQGSSGGGGFYTNGSDSYGSYHGYSYLNGGQGGSVDSSGPAGFGGGGGIHGNHTGGGGGGGYSGGAGGANYHTPSYGGGGGGSYNSGTNQSNSTGVGIGQGYVTIDKL
jgi:hypothetical protein